jgi:trans-2,3-dihydro-3-hydroxyanthranilate isomerase
MEICFYQVDVFTNHIFSGNPLAVFIKAENFTEDELQKVAREMNLSETTFVYPSTKDEADFDVRIFTPTQEIPFAGHPTLGTAYVLRKYCTVMKNPLHLNFKTGIIPVWTEEEKIFMEHPPAQILHNLDRSKKIAKALGLPLNCLNKTLPISVVSTGFPALIVPLNSYLNINSIDINTKVLHEVLDPLGVNMIYPFCRETLHPESSVHVRAFAPTLGITEDPATGSVAGAMGFYWNSINDEKGISLIIEQGHSLQRPSFIHVDVSKNHKIRVGGQCESVFTGKMKLGR